MKIENSIVRQEDLHFEERQLKFKCSVLHAVAQFIAFSIKLHSQI